MFITKPKFLFTDLEKHPDQIDNLIETLNNKSSLTISNIPLSNLNTCYRLFSNIMSTQYINAHRAFATFIDLNCTGYTAKFVYPEFYFSIKSKTMYDLSEDSNWLIYDLANQISSIVDLPLDIIEGGIELKSHSIDGSITTVKIDILIILATLAKDGYYFSPLFNSTYFSDFQEMSMMENARWSDAIQARRRSNLGIEKQPARRKHGISIIRESQTPEPKLRNTDFTKTLSKRSNSFVDMTSLYNCAIPLTTEEREFQLKNNAYPIAPSGTRMGHLKLLAMFFAEPKEPLTANLNDFEACIELEDKYLSTYRLNLTYTNSYISKTKVKRNNTSYI